MHNTLSIGGEYRVGAGYSEIKTLLVDGYRIVECCGFRGSDLRSGARIYVKVFRQFYEQSGGCKPDSHLEAELIARVVEELQKGDRTDR